MVFDWATQSPYTGGTVTFIETYRGWSIYFLGHWGLQFYGAVDPSGVEKTTFSTTLSGIRNLIDGWILQYPFTTVTNFVIPASLPAGAPIGELVVTARNTGGGAGRLEVYIDSPSYTIAAGTSPTNIAPGDTYVFHLTPLDPWNVMPDHDYTLTARNYEGSPAMTKTIQLEEIETQHFAVYGYEMPAGALVSFGDVTLDGVTKSGAGRTYLYFYNTDVGRHTIELKNLPEGYTFSHWASIIGGPWVEVLIDNPNSLSTGITTQSGGDYGGLQAWLNPPEPEGWLFIETYREVANIWLYQTAGEYWGYYFAIEGQQWGPYSTLQTCRDAVDDFLEPDPDVRITTLNYPSEARAGEKVTITWYWKNEGGDGGVPQWTRIRDLDTGGLVSPGEMGFALVPGGVAGVTIYPNMPNRDWRLRAETGYEDTITDTRDFTISIEPEDVVVYCWDATNERYLGSFGDVTLDGVTKNADGRTNIIFNNLDVGRHTVEIKNLKSGYDFDHWRSSSGGNWVEVLIDSPNSPSTGITTQSGGPGFLQIWVTESLPSSATVTVKGRATGGFPIPTIRLYVYDKGVLVGYKDFSSISIGSWYTYEKVITGAGVHQVYGRMRLRNALGSFYKNTETVEFELG